MIIDVLSNQLKNINGYTAKEIFIGEITIYAPYELGVFEYKSFKKPLKKQIDLNWLINKCKYVLKNKEYQNLTNDFKNISELVKKELNIKSYASSYGIGIDTFCASHEKIHDIKDSVLNLLKNKGINADFSISDASYVLQIKISKSKENIQKIKSLKN